MQAKPRRNGYLIFAFVLAMFIIVTLAFSSTTWAAPNAQGTVPTPPGPTSTAPTDVPPDNGNDNDGDNGGDNGGDNSGDDNSSDNSNDSGTQGGGSSGNAPVAAPGSGSVCAIGDAGAQCAVTDLVLVVGAGAAAPGSALTIEGSFPQPPCPASPTGHTFLDRCYRYTWIGTNAEPLTTISAPVQYCISYGPEQLAAVNNNATSLLIGVAGADGAWSMLKPVVDPSSNRTCATSNQMIVWSGLFAPQNPSELLPTVGAPFNQLWIVAVAGMGIVLLLGASLLRKTTTK